MGVWEPVFRNDLEAEGAKSVSLRQIDTDIRDADRPNYRSRMVLREIQKATEKLDVPSAAELFSGMPPLESEKSTLCLSLTVKKKRKASEPLQRTTSPVRTSMAYPFEECLWNSQMK